MTDTTRPTKDSNYELKDGESWDRNGNLRPVPADVPPADELADDSA